MFGWPDCAICLRKPSSLFVKTDWLNTDGSTYCWSGLPTIWAAPCVVIVLPVVTVTPALTVPGAQFCGVAPFTLELPFIWTLPATFRGPGGSRVLNFVKANLSIRCPARAALGMAPRAAGPGAAGGTAVA